MKKTTNIGYDNGYFFIPVKMSCKSEGRYYNLQYEELLNILLLNLDELLLVNVVNYTDEV